MLISQSIPNLVNGISQQPFTLRLASQAELQENGLSTTAQGLRKRPPTRHLKKILSGTFTGSFIHTINRDAIERYVVVVTNGDLKVFDLAGVEKTVSFPSGKAYLTNATPSTGFRAVTVADYTFIVNRGITVTTAATLSSVRPFEALVSIKAGNFGKTYNVIIDGTIRATFTTPDGTAGAHTAQVATDFIATELYNDLIAWAGAGFTFTRIGSVIHIYSSTDFTIRCEDGFNNGAMVALKGQVQKFQDLPANAGVTDFAVEVVGDKQTGFDNFWVKFDSAGSGAWREAIEPGTRLGLTNATLPHTLVRNGDGTFTFAPAVWSLRTCGTLDSNPDPSFTGRKITDVFFYRNRLGFLSDESVIFSEASEFFNFYRTTVTELLDSDMIDVSVSHTKVATLNYAMPFNRQLLLFSEQTQFVLEAQDLLTPKTISIKAATEFENDSAVKPAVVGKNVYFAVQKDAYTGLREYYPVDEVTGVYDSVEVSAHAPTYIPRGIYKIAPCLTEDLVVMLSTQERSSMWIYKFFFNDKEKLQSSWSKWTVDAGDSILNADFILSDMVLVVQRSDGLYLEKMTVSDTEPEADEPYLVHLDRKLSVDSTVLTFDGTHTIIPAINLPGPITGGSWEAIVALGQPKKAGIRLPLIADGATAKILGNYSNCDLIIGREYTFRYVFSPITVKQQLGQATKSDTVGRLQLRNMQINFSETGYFKTLVTPKGRSTNTYIYSGKTLGLTSATIGQLEMDTGNTKFPILSQNTGVDIEINSDAPLPCSFLSADWEGFYVKRSKGM